MNEQNLSRFNQDTESEKETLVQDNRLIFTRILSLKELACFQVAFALCYRGFLNIKKWDDILENEYNWSFVRHQAYLKSFVTQENELNGVRYGVRGMRNETETFYSYVVKSLLQHLVLPATIQLTLRRCISDVIIKVKQWSKYQNREIFSQRHETYAFNFLGNIVWKSDGDINYRETAVKMLSQTNISISEKFKIVSKFCLEHYIKQFPPPIEFEHELSARDFDDPSLNYWYHILKDDRSLYLNTRFIRSKFIQNPCLFNTHAILYFWSRVFFPNEQIQQAIILIRTCGLEYQRPLLLEMNESQQYCILTEIGWKIVANFVEEPPYWEFAHSTWLHVRNMITEQQFTKMIIKILLGQSDYPNHSVFLNEMWKTTPHHLKQYCLDISRNDNFLSSLISTVDSEEFTAAIIFSFLVKILLPEMKPEHRQNALNKIIAVPCERDGKSVFAEIVREGSPSLLDKFIKMCLPNADAEAEFRRKWVSLEAIESACLDMMKQDKTEELRQCVALYLPQVTDLNEYKIKLLQSEEGIKYCVNILSWRIDQEDAILEDMFVDIFPDSQTVQNFWKSLLQSKAALDDCFYPWLVNHRLDWVQELVERAPLSKIDKKAVKKVIISSHSTEMLSHIFYHLEKFQWEELLLWFLEDQQSFSEFKRSLNLHAFFSNLLHLMTRDVERCFDFFAINHFLRWYFDSEEQVKAFKMKQIFEFNKIECINSLFQVPEEIEEQNLSYNASFWPPAVILNCILRWFFDSDEKQIRKFKSVYASHEIIKYF